MNRGAYTAANGMIARQQQLDVLANNLANVNTRGFKSDRLTFGDMMLRTMADDSGYGNPIGALSSGPESKAETTDFGAGGIETTGNKLDFALSGGSLAMFAVRDAKGNTHYTRNGSFGLNDRSELVTKDGDAVLDATGSPIVGLTGILSVGPNGGIIAGGKTVSVGRFLGDFTKATQGGNLYDGTGTRAAATGDDVAVQSGALETANVNPVLAMVDMIALQRSYEIAQKMIQSQDDSTAKLAETIG